MSASSLYSNLLEFQVGQYGEGTHEVVRDNLRRAIEAGLHISAKDLEENGLSIDEFLDSTLEAGSPESRLTSIWDALVPALERWLPRDVDRNLLLSTLVKPLHSTTAAAFTCDANGEPLIVLDDALHDLAYHYVKLAFASWFVVERGVSPVEEGRRISIETAARVARITLGSLRWDGGLWQPISVVLEPAAAGVAVEVLEAGLKFVLAHEFGHAALGHFRAKTQTSLSFGPCEIRTPSPTHELELEADAFAANVVLNPDRLGDVPADANFQLRLLGIRLVLECIDSLDRVYYFASPGTHPSPALRFAKVLAKCGYKKEDVVAGALGFLEVAMQFSAALKNPTWRYESTIADEVQSSDLLHFSARHSEADMLHVDLLDTLETRLSRPAQVSFAFLGGAAFGAKFLEQLPTLAREVAEHLLLQGSDLSEDEQRSDPIFSKRVDLKIQTALGEAFFFNKLPAIVGIEKMIALLSPSPGKTFADWTSDLGKHVPADLTFSILHCMDRARIEPLQAIRSTSPEFSAIAEVIVDKYLRTTL